MRNALKSLFSLRARKNRRQAKQAYSRLQPAAAEALEDRALLAAQLISANTNSIEIQPNQQFTFDVLYTTLDDQGNPTDPEILATLLQTHLHYDSNELNLISITDVFDEDNITAPSDGTEASFGADDGDNTTDRAIFAGWFQGFAFDGWPNQTNFNGRLFTAIFEATANFDGTTINFSPGDTANVFGQSDQFTFQSSPLQLTLPATPPAISVSDASAVTEGQQAAFTVSLDKASTDTVTVQVSTANDTAVSGSDYDALTDTLTFLPGEIQKVVNVFTRQESDLEDTETFFLNASSPANATIDDAQGIGTINDDDTVTPDLTINNPAAVVEGSTIEFTVSLAEAATQTVTVDYATAQDGSPNAATSGIDGDFTATGGTLTFNVGQTSQTISVQTVDDPNQENAETFAVELSNISGAVLADASGTGTINDNDSVTPGLSIDDVTAVEGTTFVFTVTLSPASNSEVTVNYATETDNGPNGATVGDDFADTSGSLTFAPGETSKSVTITTVDDPDVEGDELFNVLLSNASGASISDSSGLATITDNDASQPTVSIAPAPAVIEGNDSIFTVSLSAASLDTITVDYATADGNGPIGAMAPGDYTSATGTVTFAPGETEKTISISTIDDSLNEQNEEFSVSLSNPSNASLGTSNALGIINDNDELLPTISVADAPDAFEGDNAIFTVTLSAAASSTITVNYRTVDGNGPLGATSPADFDEVTNGTVTFLAGQTQQLIQIPAKSDGETESSESFGIELFNPSGANLSVANATGNILDPPPTVSVSDATTVVEGSDLTFTISLNEQVSSPLTVNYTVDGEGNNPATAGADFTPISGNVEFTPGPVLQQTITINTFDDSAFEGTEGLAVNLTTAPGGIIADGQGLGSIADNDLPQFGGAIEGRKFDDQNGDGVRDPNEPYLNGWTITLLNASHQV
ncbi:MAG TPA: hypothetical protein DCG12_04165, partial [Planctomycetaceae bacterium]|nr:hypothetical protein [Planctomycetaceae bacterium]